ncbi:lipopolysaccharide biosynthesis protein [Anaeromyxobacter sp. K]|uniref:LPS biosynthesis protein n=1 Tax=Anaeromyxobacter sp. (strain K) TaxID=447217 RepID=UPI00015F8551|nr:LPS biosynthesis protein [Anaeromyxobacter sp. K]ACG74106.1 lipopolysaccharide biosynthesis protein [Anaeromyxobacter sp. K]
MTPDFPRLTDGSSYDGGPPPGPKVTPLDWLRLTVRAARRRKVVAIAVFSCAFALSLAFAATRKPVYRVYTTILAQRSSALPSAARVMFEDLPTRSAWEIIHRRENLVAIVKETNLAAGASGTVEPDLRTRVKRALGIGRASTPMDPLDRLVLVLDKELEVSTEEGTITIKLDWPDPRQAHAVVQAALQNFLESRHVQEVTAIDEIISVLRGRAAVLRKNLDEVMADVQHRRPPPARSTAAPVAAGPSEELVRLQSLLASKQRAIEDLENFRRRRIAEVEAQLQQALNALSEVHPTVIGLRQELAAASRESPQIGTLREEERKLRAQVIDRAAREGTTPSAAAFSAPLAASDTTRTGDDPRVVEARAQYEQMNQRLGAAQVELEAARAAFKYRYNVVWPPQVPQSPSGNSRLEVALAGLLFSLALGLAVAAAPDIVRGRIMQRWQVERSLELPVLGEMRRER